ncbi:MAG TPA: hypothetical protein VKR83_11030 [Ktedonobacteraceae bacterium]|nr:hypothetical protein [Ktedonobacteraceae bacterium]
MAARLDNEIDGLRNVAEEQADCGAGRALADCPFSIVRDPERIGDGAAGAARTIRQLLSLLR